MSSWLWFTTEKINLSKVNEQRSIDMNVSWNDWANSLCLSLIKTVAYLLMSIKSSSNAMVSWSNSWGVASKNDSSKLALLAVLLILMMVTWFEGRLVSKRASAKKSRRFLKLKNIQFSSVFEWKKWISLIFWTKFGSLDDRNLVEVQRLMNCLVLISWQIN